jgi:hypothetical protein
MRRTALVRSLVTPYARDGGAPRRALAPTNKLSRANSRELGGTGKVPFLPCSRSAKRFSAAVQQANHYLEGELGVVARGGRRWLKSEGGLRGSINHPRSTPDRLIDSSVVRGTRPVEALFRLSEFRSSADTPHGSASWRVCIPLFASAHANLRPREVCVRESNRLQAARHGRSTRDWL